MHFDYKEILGGAIVFANERLKQKQSKPSLSQLPATPLEFDKIIASDYGTEYACDLILGAIDTYHEQLREALLDHGIDIGDFISE